MEGTVLYEIWPSLNVLELRIGWSLTLIDVPYNRYRWKRLPFALKVSSNFFQNRILQVIDNLLGVLCMANDIRIFDGDIQEHSEKFGSFLQQRMWDEIKLSRLKLISCKTTVIDMGITPGPEEVRNISHVLMEWSTTLADHCRSDKWDLSIDWHTRQKRGSG